jgi:FMN phosphatase YigB (HAD superfamily)
VASAEWEVAKPDAEFFRRVAELTDTTEPGEVLYVGDHPANDVFPARALGMRTAHIRRGPSGHLWADDPNVREAADWSIDTLLDLPDLVAPTA